MSMLLHKVCSTSFQRSFTNEMTERESLICRLIRLHSFFPTLSSFCYSVNLFALVCTISKFFERCKTRIIKTYVFLNKFLATAVMNLTKNSWSMETNNKKASKEVFMILVIYDLGYNQRVRHDKVYWLATN